VITTSWFVPESEPARGQDPKINAQLLRRLDLSIPELPDRTPATDAQPADWNAPDLFGASFNWVRLVDSKCRYCV